MGMMEHRVEEIASTLKKISQLSPNQTVAWSKFAEIADQEGALSPRRKAIIEVALSVCAKCEWCIAYYVNKALKLGARRQEIVEAAWVAVMMGGGPALMHAQLVLDALEEFKEVEEEEPLYPVANLKNEEMEGEFKKLYQQLLDYVTCICDEAEAMCDENKDRLKLALQMAETDISVLQRLVTKECDNRGWAEPKEDELIYFDLGIKNEEVDKELDVLYDQLLNYTRSIFDLTERFCQRPEDQIRLALKIGETDGNLLPRLVAKECEKRRLRSLKSDFDTSINMLKKPVVYKEIANTREKETLTIKDIAEMILEAQHDQQIQPMLINKSRCGYGKIGAVLFTIYGDPVKGFALFLPDGSHGNRGTLHIFDEFGIKRKIRSNVKLLDLEDFKDTDTFHPDKELTLEKSKIEALMVPSK